MQQQKPAGTGAAEVAADPQGAGSICRFATWQETSEELREADDSGAHCSGFKGSLCSAQITLYTVILCLNLAFNADIIYVNRKLL